MANQDISLTNYDPDAAKIQRQQRLAQMLQEQSQQDIPIQSYNGIQAPISPFSLIAKALQAYQGKKLADQSDTQYGDLQTKRRKDFADMLSKQYQVPGSNGTVTNQPDTQNDVNSITAPTISGVTEDRPTTPQEQMANSLSMMGSNNPMAANMAPQLYEDAQKKQQAAQLLSGLDLSKVPTAMAPVIRSQIQAGDIPGATKTYEAAVKPQVVGGNLLTPNATGYDTAYAAKPAAVQEYEYAKTQGFKGSLTDYEHTKAAATHITVQQGGAPQTADQRASTAAMAATGMPLAQVVPGFGAASVQSRTQARNDAVALIMQQNPGMNATQAGQEFASRQMDFAGGKSSVSQLTKMAGATKQNVDQLALNVNNTKTELAKLGSSNISPILNAIARGEQKWTGNPAYSSAFYYLSATANEAARLQSGGQASAAQLHQGAQDAAKEWMNMNMTPASFAAVGDAMINEGRQKLQTFSDAREAMRNPQGHIVAQDTRVAPPSPKVPPPPGFVIHP